MNDPTVISVVIPTRQRPALVTRAVESALAQTFKSIEVIVVVDGPGDDKTVDFLNRIKDHRLRIVVLQQNVGGADARNAGVQAANGEWIAFLDDDDEWLPEKLAKQLKASSRSRKSYPVISSYFIYRTPVAEYVWPRRVPHPTEPISEYLFVRDSFFWGEGLLITPTLLAKKRLLELIPFRSGLKKHQDWDWILRVAGRSDVCFEIVPEPLAIWNSEDRYKKSVSTECMWRYSLDWLRKSQEMVTPRAYAGFVATQLASQASRQGEWSAFAPLLREMFRGSPKAIDLLLFISMWIVPQNLRQKVRALFKQ